MGLRCCTLYYKQIMTGKKLCTAHFYNWEMHCVFRDNHVPTYSLVDFIVPVK